jgi:branched-chain amino acid transport system permease protein
METFILLTVTGLANGAILALAALGFALVYKATGVINFAQGEFLAVGAWSVFAAIAIFGFHWTLAIGFGVVVAVVLAILVERLVLRPMVGESAIAVIMVTIGLTAVIASVLQILFGTSPRRLPPVFPSGTVELIGTVLPVNRLVAIASAAVVLAGFMVFFKRSRQGIAMRAVADDQQAAMVQGINVNRIFGMAWALSGMSAAVAGLLLASINGQYNLQDIQFFGIYVFPVVILGGLDSLLGTVVGGAIVGILAQFVGGYVATDLQEVIPFVVLVLILLIKPYGLFGEVRIERV